MNTNKNFLIKSQISRFHLRKFRQRIQNYNNPVTYHNIPVTFPLLSAFYTVYDAYHPTNREYFYLFVSESSTQSCGVSGRLSQTVALYVPVPVQYASWTRLEENRLVSVGVVRLDSWKYFWSVLLVYMNYDSNN